jgi:simple sugar transport system permease protein
MRERLLRYFRGTEFYLLLVILALVAVLSAATPAFFTLGNLFDMLSSYSFLSVMAAGLLVVLISGNIDISFTATASVAQYVAVGFINKHGGGWLTVFGIAGLVGIALGAVNAVLVHHLRISSIIVTIATLNIFYGILIFVTHGDYIYSVPDWFGKGFDLWSYTDADDNNSYYISLQIWIVLLVFVVTYLLLNRSAIGRQIYALGGNPDAAQRLGINIFGLTLFCYCWMGLMAGIASVIQAQLTQSVAPTVLVGKELDVVAAVVLGGASLNGGVGSVFGTVLGILLLASMQSGLIMVGVSSYWSQVFVGAVILIAVSATAYSARLKHRRRARA